MLSAPPAQEHPPMILGIDLTASERKPTACAALDARGGLAHIGFERADVDILALTRKQSAASEAQIALPKS